MIRWLVVGSGMAGRCHLAAIAQTPQAALAGIVTLDEPPPGIGPVYHELTAALAATSPDAVILATPHVTHLPLALNVIEHGLPVLCEKPVGCNTADARQILAAAESAGTSVGVVLNQRATAHHRWIRQLIAAGDLNPRAVTFSGTLVRLSGWHSDASQAGGGVLRSIGVHYLDLLRWWLGEPDALSAVTSGGEAENAVCVAMKFPGGALGTLQLTAMGASSAGPMSCIIEAPPARLILSGHVITDLEQLPSPPAAEPSDSALAFGPGHLQIMAEATAALLAEQALPLSLAETIPSMELVDRAYAAARSALAT